MTHPLLDEEGPQPLAVDGLHGPNPTPIQVMGSGERKWLLKKTQDISTHIVFSPSPRTHLPPCWRVYPLLLVDDR